MGFYRYSWGNWVENVRRLAMEATAPIKFHHCNIFYTWNWNWFSTVMSTYQRVNEVWFIVGHDYMNTADSQTGVKLLTATHWQRSGTFQVGGAIQVIYLGKYACIYTYIYMYISPIVLIWIECYSTYKTSPQLYSQVGCKPSLSRSHLRLSSTSFETTPRTLPGFRTRLEWICRIPSGKLLHSELENHHLE